MKTGIWFKHIFIHKTYSM